MKKIWLGLYLIIMASALCSAQSALWAGNAARGNDDAYPASIRSSGKAAGMSLALPEGTLVQVRNQKNGQTVDVTIVSGQGKPGIFLLLNSAAADALSIHTGEVIMVEIQEKSAVSNPFLDYSADPDSFKKNLNEDILAQSEEDPDNVASLDVDEEMSRMGYAAAVEETAEEASEEDAAVDPALEESTDIAVLPDSEEESPAPADDSEVLAPEEPEETITLPETDDDRDFDEIIIADSEESYDAVLDYSDGEGEDAPGDIPEDGESDDAAPSEGTPFLSEDLTLSGDSAPAVSSEAEEAVPEEAGDAAEEATPIDPDRVIYFLTPADLRPPEPAEDEAPPLPVWEKEEDVLTVTSEGKGAGEGDAETESAGEDGSLSTGKEPEIRFVPQYVDLEELEKYMRDSLEDGSRYVQVASFGTEDSRRVYDNMVELQKSFPYLPIILLPGKGGDTFKLMVGPVSRDEVGILLYTMKSRGFPDAFLNRE